MKNTINLKLLHTAAFDSGSLGMLASVIHQFHTPGRHSALVTRRGLEVGDIHFDVDEGSAVTQLNIDLSQTGQGEGTPRVVSPTGYVIFYASAAGGYAVITSPPDGKESFHSAKLGKGDLFAVSLLKPGKYSVTNKLGGAAGEISVGMTPEIALRIKSLETVYVEASKKGFKPNHVEVTSTQGLVFRIMDEARIVIEAKEGAEKLRIKPSVKWRKPLSGENTGN